MATRINDHWLWLGFGLFFLAAAKGIQYAIGDIVTLTELDSTTPKEEDNDRPEDTISLPTLRSLSKHPNPSIASAAQSLIVTRFAASPNAADLLTNDLSSADETLSRKAKQAIIYLQEWDAELNGADTLLEEYDQVVHDEAERLLTGTGHGHSRVEELGDTVTRLEDLAALREGLDGPRLGMEGVRRGIGDEDEGVERFGQARFAGWERVPIQRPVAGEREDERRRRRREAMVVSEWDNDHF